MKTTVCACVGWRKPDNRNCLLQFPSTGCNWHLWPGNYFSYVSRECIHRKTLWKKHNSTSEDWQSVLMYDYLQCRYEYGWI